MLLNIDKPLKKATLHNEFCPSVPKPYESRLKPVGRIGQEGGWFHVDSEDNAKQIAGIYCPLATFVRCSKC